MFKKHVKTYCKVSWMNQTVYLQCRWRHNLGAVFGLDKQGICGRSRTVYIRNYHYSSCCSNCRRDLAETSAYQRSVCVCVCIGNFCNGCHL